MDSIYKTEKQFEKTIPYHIRLLYEYTTLTFYKEWNNKSVWDKYDLDNFILKITHHLESINISTFLLKDYIIYLMVYKYKILQRQEIIVYSSESHITSRMPNKEIDSIKRKYYYEKAKYEKEKREKENANKQ